MTMGVKSHRKENMPIESVTQKPANGNTGIVPPWLEHPAPDSPVLMDDENKAAIDQFIKKNPPQKD